MRFKGKRNNNESFYDSEVGCIIGGDTHGLYFGGGGGSKSSTTTTAPSKEQRAILNKQLGYANKYENLGPMEYYGGDTLAEESQYTDIGRMMQLGAAGSQGALSEAGMARFQDAMNYDPMTDPRNQQTVDAMMNPLRQDFQENILPGISSAAVKGGAFGGDRADILKSTAARDTAGAMADTSAKAWQSIIDSNRQNQQSMMGMLPQLQQSALSPSQTVLDVGAQQEGRSQAEIDANRERFDFGQQAQRDVLTGANSMLGGIDFGSISKTTNSGGK